MTPPAEHANTAEHCPTCGAAVQVVGKTTKYYKPAEHANTLPNPLTKSNADLNATHRWMHWWAVQALRRNPK